MAASARCRRPGSLRNHAADRTLAYPAAAPTAPCWVCGQPTGTPATQRAGSAAIPAESQITTAPSATAVVGAAGPSRDHGRITRALASTATAAIAISQRRSGHGGCGAPDPMVRRPTLNLFSSRVALAVRRLSAWVQPDAELPAAKKVLMTTAPTPMPSAHMAETNICCLPRATL
jgi:hypothetical protein